MMYVNTKIIADAIDKGTSVSAEALQLSKDIAYNKMLEDTFEERAYQQRGVRYTDMSGLEKLIVRKVLYTDMLRKVY